MKSRARTLARKTAFHGPVFQVTSDQVREPTGVTVRRDVVRHPGSVVILPADVSARGTPRVLLEWQYRYAVDAFLWELPAGRVARGETELAAAKRELLEETGYTATQWKRALTFYASPGFLDETMAIYLATGLQPGKAQPEDDEVIRLRFFPLSAALRMAMSGAIRDGKTIAALFWYERMHGRSTRRP